MNGGAGPRRPVTDAQVHIWAADTPDRPWPPDGHTWAHRSTPFGADDLLAEMDAAGVDRAVLVPPSFEGDRNDLVLAAARRHPERFAVMGRIAVTHPAAADHLAELAAQPGLLGVRLTFHRPGTRRRLTDGSAAWLWPELERRALPVMVYAPGQNAAIREIARRHPGLRIVVDTLGLTLGMRDGEIDGPIRDLTALADRPNVAVKATALPSFTTDTYPFRSLAPRIRRVLDAFGARRVCWASDLTRVRHRYRDIVASMAGMGVLSDEEWGWVMGRAAGEWLGWPSGATGEAPRPIKYQ